MVALSGPTFAANFAVTNTNDSGAGSLRQAIIDTNAAGSGNTITLQPGLGAINLASNLPLVATSVSIVGNGNTLDGASTYRGFLISGIAANGIDAAATTVSISNLTIQNVRAKGGDGAVGGGGGLGAGGAVFVGPSANVTLSNVAVTNTTAIGGNGGVRGSGSSGGGGGLGGNGGAVGNGLSGGGGGLFFSGGASDGGTLGGGGGGGITSPGANGSGFNGGNGGTLIQ